MIYIYMIYIYMCTCVDSTAYIFRAETPSGAAAVKQKSSAIHNVKVVAKHSRLCNLSRYISVGFIPVE